MKKMNKKLEKKEEKVVDTANTDVFVYVKKNLSHLIHFTKRKLNQQTNCVKRVFP